MEDTLQLSYVHVDDVQVIWSTEKNLYNISWSGANDLHVIYVDIAELKCVFHSCVRVNV